MPTAPAAGGCPQGHLAPSQPPSARARISCNRRPEDWKAEAAAAAVAPGASASFEDHERELLTDALQRAGGNQSGAARILRISRDRMRYKMGKYNLH